MLTAIGYHVELKLKSGRVLKPRGVLFYDMAGTKWPKTSCLIGNKPEGHPSRPGRSKWFGQGYDTLQTVDYEIIPGAKAMLLNLKNWRFVNEISRITYDRGMEHPDRAHDEPLDEPTVQQPRAYNYTHDFDKDALPELFQRGAYYRIQLQPGTKLNLRGFVEPNQ
jgi:hypothetical protein